MEYLCLLMCESSWNILDVLVVHAFKIQLTEKLLLDHLILYRVQWE